MFKIQIPKPCHAEWSDMTPTQQGAFCGSCSKEVVDFTKMNDEEVQNYFLQKSTGSTCGRFRTEQIHRIRISLPDNIFIQKIAGWKKFMAVVMLAFGSMLFGCDVGVDNNTTGKVEKVTVTNTKLTGDTTTIVDTTETLGRIAMPMGKPVMIKNDTASCKVSTGGTVKYPELMGDVAFVTDTVVTPKTETSTNTTMGEPAIINFVTKKPATDTVKCGDKGFY